MTWFKPGQKSKYLILQLITNLCNLKIERKNNQCDLYRSVIFFQIIVKSMTNCRRRVVCFLIFVDMPFKKKNCA